MNAVKRVLLSVLMIGVLVIGVAPSVSVAQDEEKYDHSVTSQGSTGLFHVLSPDTMNKGHVSFGVVHRNYDRKATDVDVNDLMAVFAIGASDRIELGLAYSANRQTDFDRASDAAFYNNLPHAVTTIENGGGDLYLNFKYALARMEDSGSGVAILSRFKVPTGKEDAGRGTGGYDFSLGASAGTVSNQLGLYGNAMYTRIGDSSTKIGEIDLADMVNWGAGLELGAKSWLKGIVEVTGEHFVSVPSSLPEQDDNFDVALGFKIGGAGHGGVTLGGAYVHNLGPSRPRDVERQHGWIGELTFTTSPPKVAPPPMTTADPANRPPTAVVSANPKEVYPSYSSKTTKSSTVTCQASDPDGDPLQYAWTASGGRVTGAGSSVTWFPPDGVEEGTFTITARVSDGKGGQTSASDTVTVRADPEWFEGRVQFEFDRYELDDADRQVVQRAVSHLRRFPDLRLSIEGHTCYIATEEYNLALGQHRAQAIQDYLIELGVDGSRLSTISYGETRPVEDNGREITRRLNRRGEFRFRFTR